MAAGDPRGLAVGAKVLVAVRPEALRLMEQPTADTRPGLIKSVMPLGPQVAYDIETDDGCSLKAGVARDGAAGLRDAGARVHVAPTSISACNVFPAGDLS